MKAIDARKAIQAILGTAQDGFGPWGHNDTVVLDRLGHAAPDSEWPPVVPDAVTHQAQASSFADPKDVAAFKRCKAQGKSDQECFKVGDNGKGTPSLGDGGRETDTTGPTPMCALAPEIWKPLGDAARGKKVIVECEGKTVTCELRDTLPHGSDRIDLNEAAWLALGHTPPQLRSATWRWA